MSVWSPMDGGGDDDWGLQAVVRGCRPTKNPEAAAAMDLPLLPATEAKGDLTASFPGLTEARTALHELEELCKPFFPKPQHHHHPHHHLVVSPSRSNPSSPSSSAAAAAGNGAGGGGPHQQRQPQRPASHAPRSKRRKNQQKRVVCHVPADGVSSDVWAWRKYGQKPIKGSPYPRGYYRCSSSKGCLARKQVERSRTDPAMLVITYTAEHNHPVPTHRNSLAGSTRHKFPTTTTTSATASSTDQPPSATSPTSGAEVLSPTTPLTASMDEDQEDEDGVLLVEDMEVVGEDDLLFVGGCDGELDSEDQPGGAPTVAAAAAAAASGAILEGDVVGGFEDQFFARPWRANHNAAAAAGGR